MLEKLGDVIQSCELIRNLPVGTKLFRARGYKEGTNYATPGELGPPPVEFAKTAGRMNAPGIVVFYGALDRRTAAAEATGSHLHLSIGEFETLVDLTIVDLTDLPRVPSIFEGANRDSLLFLHHFAEEVSQPFEPDADIHIEYVPTQIVSEYLRHRLRAEDSKAVRGVLYRSAKRPDTKNLALFIDSIEVKGVGADRWRLKESVLRLTSVEEIIKVPG